MENINQMHHYGTGYKIVYFFAFLWYFSILSLHSVRLTNYMAVPKSVILLEGLFFSAAYYLRTLDYIGVMYLMIGHICTIVPILTELRIFSVIFMAVFAALYPVCSLYTYLQLIARYMTMIAKDLPFLISEDKAEGVHIFLGIGYMVYTYFLVFRYQGNEDLVIGTILLWTACYLPNISTFALLLMVPSTLLWMYYKTLRFPPLIMFPRRFTAP